MDYRTEAPEFIRDFLTYHETIINHSRLTVNEYYLDLRLFFRFIKVERGLVSDNIEFNDIPIDDVDITLVKTVTSTDVYAFMAYLSRERERFHNSPGGGVGLSAASRSRKISTIRTFYKYLTKKVKLLDENPMTELDTPKLKRKLPRFLSLDESVRLLEACDGINRVRDYCIIMIFLNCGLRISELCGLNVRDIGEESLRVLGKGNKERTVYFGEAVADAIGDWLIKRKSIPSIDSYVKGALFVTSRKTRVSRDAVHHMVKRTLLKAGLDASKYSSHKLRHTAATLMHENGVDIRTIQEVLGHENLNTTEIYTHVVSEDLRKAAQKNPLSSMRKKPSK